MHNISPLQGLVQRGVIDTGLRCTSPCAFTLRGFAPFYWMKFRSIFILIFLLSLIFAFYSCIEPFKPELDNKDTASLLAVEGQVTDETGPFKVRLTKSGPVYTYQDIYKIDPVSDANVHISDDKENDFQLYPVENGWYETEDKNLKGVPGNTYTLHITDKDGSQYESTPELLLDVSDIDSVFYEEEQRTRIEGETVSLESWLNILLNTRASGNGIHYFKWEFEETWEFKMPEYVRITKHIRIEGIIIDSAYMVLLEIAPEKLHCWVSEASKSILIKSTASNLSGEIKRYPLTSIGPGDDRLSTRYSILVKQFALDKELYDFFKKLEDVNETNGGMYDKIPAPVFGNIMCCSGNKKALGYFFASGVKTKRIFIDNLDVHVERGYSAYSGCGWEYPQLIGDYYFYGKIVDGNADVGTDVWSRNKYCTDCRERGTDVKPDFWE